MALDSIENTTYLSELNNSSGMNEHMMDLTQYDKDSKDTITIVQYWAWGVVGNTIAVFGILGNILAIMVLAQPRMRSSTAVYLIAQAFFDILVLISMTLFFSINSIHHYTGQLEAYSRFFPYMQPYGYPFALIAQTCSIYITVAFTAERYVAVCYPLRATRWCTAHNARRALALIVVGAIIINIPRMFEYETRVMVVDNVTTVNFVPTKMGNHYIFKLIYVIFIHVTVMMLIPFASLTFMNSMLIRAVRKSHHSQGKVVNAKQHKENNLTIMLIAVVAVFLLCQLPSIPDNIFAATLDPYTINKPVFVKLTCIASLMVIMNSAFNFYLYCVFGHKFRRVFCHLFCWRWQCCSNMAGLSDGDTSVMLRGSSVGRGTGNENCPNGGGGGSQHSTRSQEKSGSVSPRPVYRYSKQPMGMRVSLSGSRSGDKAPNNTSCQYTSIRHDRASETNV